MSCCGSISWGLMLFGWEVHCVKLEVPSSSMLGSALHPTRLGRSLDKYMCTRDVQMSMNLNFALVAVLQVWNETANRIPVIPASTNDTDSEDEPRFWKHGLSVWGAPTDYEGTASDTKQAQQPRDTTCSDANGSSHATVIPGLITILPPPPCAETKGNNRRMCKFSLMKTFYC